MKEDIKTTEATSDELRNAVDDVTADLQEPILHELPQGMGGDWGDALSRHSRLSLTQAIGDLSTACGGAGKWVLDREHVFEGAELDVAVVGLMRGYKTRRKNADDPPSEYFATRQQAEAEGYTTRWMSDENDVRIAPSAPVYVSMSVLVRGDDPGYFLHNINGEFWVIAEFEPSVAATKVLEKSCLKIRSAALRKRVPLHAVKCRLKATEISYRGGNKGYAAELMVDGFHGSEFVTAAGEVLA